MPQICISFFLSTVSVIILCSVNPKYTNLILQVRLGLGLPLGLRSGLSFIRVNSNRKSNANSNLISRIKFVCLGTWNYYQCFGFKFESQNVLASVCIYNLLVMQVFILILTWNIFAATSNCEWIETIQLVFRYWKWFYQDKNHSWRHYSDS